MPKQATKTTSSSVIWRFKKNSQIKRDVQLDMILGKAHGRIQTFSNAAKPRELNKIGHFRCGKGASKKYLLAVLDEFIYRVSKASAVVFVASF